jgi:carbon storage regulator
VSRVVAVPAVRTTGLRPLHIRSLGSVRRNSGGWGPLVTCGTKESRAMLVLSRHRDESIIINDNIVVTIVDIRGDKVRLGIQAPTNIPVHRQEIYDAIQREKKREGEDAGPKE